MITADLRERRTAILEEHFRSEEVTAFDLLGTNLGDFYGPAPTGRSLRVPVIAAFAFEGDREIGTFRALGGSPSR